MPNIRSDYANIAPEDLRDKRERGDDFLLLDVRSPMEHGMDAIEGSFLLPVQELGFRADELPRDKEIVVYCRVGNRSAFAAAHLARLGFTVSNLEGGIEAWNRCETCALAAA
jgi:rhodanese-related sulfurtransferase